MNCVRAVGRGTDSIVTAFMPAFKGYNVLSGMNVLTAINIIDKRKREIIVDFPFKS